MLKNISSHWVLLVVTIVSTFFLIPFNLAHLGEHKYGLWLIIASLNGYLLLLHFGVPLASLRFMTQALARKDMTEYNTIISTVSGMYIGVSAAVAVFGLALLVFFRTSFDIEPELLSEVSWSFVLSTTNVIGAMLLLVPHTILSSYQDFVRMNLLRIAAYLIRIICNLVLVSLYPSVLMLALSIVIGTVFEIVTLTILVWISYRDVRISLRVFSRDTVRQVVGYGAFVFMLAIGSQFIASTGPIVIGYALGPEQVPLFAVPNSLLLYLMDFIVGISYVILPLAAKLQVEERMDALRFEFLKWTKMATAIVSCSALFLVVFGPSFLSFWVGPAYGDTGGKLLSILLFGAFFMLPMRGVAVPILMGIGRPAKATVAIIVTGIASIALSFALIGRFGLEGVAWGVTLPGICLSAALMLFVCRDLAIPPLRYLIHTMPLPVLGLALALPVLWVWKQEFQPSGLISLGIAGVFTVAVFGVIWYFLILRNDEHMAIPPLRELLAKGLGR